MTDTKTLLVVRDGLAVDACIVPEEAVISSNGSRATWPGADFAAPEDASFVDQPGAAIGWTVEGGKLVAPPPPPAPPPVVPEAVSRAQAKIALHRAGKLDAVKAAVAQAGDEIEIWFDEAATWDRSNPHVVALGAAIGLSSAQIDGLFVTASQIAA